MISPMCPYCGAYAAWPVKKEDGEAIASLSFRRIGNAIQMYCRSCTAIWEDKYEVSRRTLIKKGINVEVEPPKQSALFGT